MTLENQEFSSVRSMVKYFMSTVLQTVSCFIHPVIHQALLLGRKMNVATPYVSRSEL
jgi:hypothetical protein